MSNFVDPWGGYNQGMESLGQAIQSADTMRRLKAVEDIEKEKAYRERTDWEQKQADALALRQALKTASKPTVRAEEIANPEYQAAQDYRAGLESSYNRTPQAQDYLGLKSQVAQYPEFAKQMGATERLAGLEQQYKSGLEQALPPATTVSPTITRQVTEQPHPLKVQIDTGKALLAQGNPLGQSMLTAAQDSGTKMITSALALGDYDVAGKLYEQLSGEKVIAGGKYKDQLQITSKDGVTSIVNGHGMTQDLAQGVPFETAIKRNTYTSGEPTDKDKTAESVYIHNLSKKYEAQGMSPVAAKLKAAEDYLAKQLEGKKELKTTVVVQPSMRQATNLPPGYIYDTKSGQYYKTDTETGKPRPLTPAESADMVNVALGFQQGKSEARSAGGVRSMVTNASYEQFKSDSKDLVDLSRTVDANLISKAMPLLGSSVNIREAEIKLKKQFGNTESAKYFSKALATAEALGNALSGSGGSTSDFKLRLAQDLVRYGYSPETLEQVLEMHGSSLKAKAGAMRSFGKPTGKGASEPLSKEIMRSIAVKESSTMKAGESRRADFKGKMGTITKDSKGGVTVTFD